MTNLPKIPPSWETTLRLLGIACRCGNVEDQDFAEEELARLGHAIDCKDELQKQAQELHAIDCKDELKRQVQELHGLTRHPPG